MRMLDHSRSGSGSKMTFNDDWKHFDSAEQQEGILEAAHATLEWLKQNTERYGTDHMLEDASPWWSSVEPTNDPYRLKNRHIVLTMKAYDHGFTHLCYELERRCVVQEASAKALDDLLDGPTYAVLIELMGYQLAGQTGHNVSLRGLKDRLGFATTTSERKVRDGILGRMSKLGVLKARVDTDGAYAVSIGRVAEAFFMNAYFPILDHMPLYKKDR
jgi:hypothetical protein